MDYVVGPSEQDRKVVVAIEIAQRSSERQL
jgi:hypothetical protein